jgi:hypothetical protein
VTAGSKLEQLLNELLADPVLGSYVNLTRGQITGIVKHVGVERSWDTVLRVAQRTVAIEEGRSE